jgi:hypothetical protein
MNESALQIEKIYHRYRIKYKVGGFDEAYLESVQKEYTAALEWCGLNHSRADYDLFRAQNPTEFAADGYRNVLKRYGTVLIYWFRVVALYVCAMIIPPAAVFLLLYYEKKAFVA